MYICIFYAFMTYCCLNFFYIFKLCGSPASFIILSQIKFFQYIYWEKIHVKLTCAVLCSRVKCLYFSRDQKDTWLPKDLLVYRDPSSPAPSGHGNAPTYLGIISGKARGMERNQTLSTYQKRISFQKVNYSNWQRLRFNWLESYSLFLFIPPASMVEFVRKIKDTIEDKHLLLRSEVDVLTYELLFWHIWPCRISGKDVLFNLCSWE